MQTHPRRLRRYSLLCSLCGEEIMPGEEYWYCSGASVCAACLTEFAKGELANCRRTRGKENEE